MVPTAEQLKALDAMLVKIVAEQKAIVRILEAKAADQRSEIQELKSDIQKLKRAKYA